MEKIDKTNMNWSSSISDREIFNQIFCFGYMLEKNDIPEFEALKKLAYSTYEVTAKFTYKGYNGDYLFCNGQVLIERKRRNSKLLFGKNVTLLDGEALRESGSIKYPTVRFIDNWCVLKFISYGLPIVSELNGWEMKILEIKKLNL